MTDYRRKIWSVRQEKREHPRLDFHCPVIIVGNRGVNKITDISAGGVFIEMKKSSAHHIGQYVNLIIKLPTENDSIRVKAKVSFVNYRGIGCKFIDLSVNNEDAIKYCFNTFRDTLPIR